MDGTKTVELLYEKAKIDCTKDEYHRDVRGAIIDYRIRMTDLGREDVAKHCQGELDRLDKQYGKPPHDRNVDL